MSATIQFTPKRKLSAKEIIGEDIKRLFRDAQSKAEAKGEKLVKLPLFKVGGFINRYDSVETNYGDSTRFIGDFIAVNAITGEAFRSNRLFLPSLMADEMTAHLASAKRKDEDGTVEFGFDVSIIPDEKSATGYVYMAEPVVKVQESDAVAALAAKLTGKNITEIRSLPEPATQPPAEEKSGGKKGDDKGDKKKK